MALDDDAKERDRAVRPATTGWGGKLFAITLLLVLAFFWWLLIYSGGVTPHHG